MPVDVFVVIVDVVVVVVVEVDVVNPEIVKMLDLAHNI